MKAKNESLKADLTTPLEEESIKLSSVTQSTCDSCSKLYEKLINGDEEAKEHLGSVALSVKRANLNTAKALRESHVFLDELNTRLAESGKKGKFTAPANAFIDAMEEKTKHFAKGINIFKLCLICFIGSFAGVILEMLWCLVTNGYIESRAGLVWGPFNLLYGFGAVILTLCLYKYRNRSSAISFLGGMAVGSVVEYLCSLFQEICFGSTSWDYSHLPFNLNGRICLMYSVFWGILGVIWVKSLYPRISRLTLKLPNKPGKIITLILTLFLAINAAVSVTATYRWNQRRQGKEAETPFWEFVDQRFPDERMEDIFANMKFK